MTTATLIRKMLNWGGSHTVSDIQFIIMWGAWRRAGTHGAWYVLIRKQYGVDTDNGKYLDHRNPQNLPPQWHTSSNQATLTSTKPHFVIVPLLPVYRDQ